MATLEVAPPVPPRSTSERPLSSPHRKQELVASFDGFDAANVSQHHIDNARACFQSGEPPSARYEIVEFVGNLNRNRVKGNGDYLTMMTSAYDLLLKYVVNLLKKKRPQVWRSIKTNNTAFRARVACMEGAFDILKEVGYSIVVDNAIQFPNDVESPNKPRLYVIAAELLMAKLEVEDINKRQTSSNSERSAAPVPRARSTSGGSASYQHNVPQSSTVPTPNNQFGHSNELQPENSSTQPYQQNNAQHYSTEHGYSHQPGSSSNQHHTPPNTGQSSASPEAYHQSPQQRYDTQSEQSQPSYLQQQQQPSCNPQPANRIPRASTSYQQSSHQSSPTFRPLQTDIRPSMSGAGYDADVKPSIPQGPLPPSAISQPHLTQPEPQHSSIESQASSGGSTGGGSSTGNSPFSSIGDNAATQSATPSDTNAVSSANEALTKIRERKAKIKALLGNRGDTRSENLATLPSEGSQKKSVTQPMIIKGSAPPVIGKVSVPPLPPKTYKDNKESEPLVFHGSDAEIRKPPGKSRHPQFRSDPILEQPEPSESGSSHSLDDLYQSPQPDPNSTTAPTEDTGTLSMFCPSCNNRIAPGDTACNYCNNRVSATNTAPPSATPSAIPEPQLPAIPPKSPPAIPQKSPHIPEPQFPAIPTQKIQETQPFVIHPQPQPPPTIPQKSPQLQRQPPAQYDEPIVRASARDAQEAEHKHRMTMTHTLRPTATEPFTPVNAAPFTPVPKVSPVMPRQKSTGADANSQLQHREFNETPGMQHHHVPEGGNANYTVKPTPDQGTPPSLPPRPQPRRDIQNQAWQTQGAQIPREPKPTPGVSGNQYSDEPKPQPRQNQAWQTQGAQLPDEPKPKPGVSQHPGRQYSDEPKPKPRVPRKVVQEPEIDTPPRVPPRPKATQGAQMNEGQGTSSASGATGSGEPASSRAAAEGESYIETLKLKEKAWKDLQIQDGITSENLKPLSEMDDYMKAKEAARLKKEKEKAAQRKKQDPSKFERVDMSATRYDFDQAQEKKMEELVKEGNHLMQSVKECHGCGYSLDEIQIAYKKHCSSNRSITPLSFLQNEWVQMIHDIQVRVPLCNKQGEPKVGRPSIEEAKRFLVEAGGDQYSATKANYIDRRKKISELCQKFEQRRALKPALGELTWEAATQALSCNKMDITAACHAVQCEWLHEVHGYIFSEYKEVVQTEYEKIKALVKNDDLDIEFRYRLLMAECRLDSIDRSEMALELMKRAEAEQDGNVPLNYCVEAARDYDDLEKAANFLIKECPICIETTSVHEMVQMPGCTCTMCKKCFKRQFEIVMKEKPVKHFRCPDCHKPDIANLDEQSFYTEMFTALIKEHLDKECYDFCMTKLNEFKLTKLPGFRWCASDQCRGGFIVDRNNPHPDHGLEVECPTCKTSMCFNCKVEWKQWHQGQSCQDFARWKKDNDPEAQEQGLAAHLTANGIECPHCHMRYDLARGGCMHFKCTQCPNEFCSGCGESYQNGMECGRYQSCGRHGLHAHHPRDCLYYLRDFPVKVLQDFLKAENIQFDVDTPPEQLEAARRKGEGAAVPEDGKAAGDGAAAAVVQPKAPLKCCVMLQKENPEGLKDEACGKEVTDGHAGLCELHYKEYLVDKINKNKLDPVNLYETVQIASMLERQELPAPGKEEDDTDEQHRESLIEAVREKLPLTFKTVQPTVRAASNVQAVADIPAEIAVQDIED